MEMMDAAHIENTYPEFNSKACSFVDAKTGRRAKDGYQRGQWTDDTQLMIPIAWSIIRQDSIDPKDIANEYAVLFNKEPRRGWGRSTVAVAERLADGVPWNEAANEAFGKGNGAAMKCAPLGLMLAQVMLRDNNRAAIRHCLNSIVDVCSITHKTEGIIAGTLQSLLIALAALDDGADLLEELAFAENLLFDTTEFSDKAKKLVGLSTVSQIVQEGGVSPLAIESWPTVAAVFCRMAPLVREGRNPIGPLFGLIQQGGDCDTTGAMLGALIGARYGIKCFPSKLVKEVEAGSHLMKIATELYEATTGIYIEYQSLLDRRLSDSLTSQHQRNGGS
jgi:poly(ADP-ribose) glycohydrolase ARH3